MQKRKGWLLIPVVFIGVAIVLLFFRRFAVNETDYMNGVCEGQLTTYANENVRSIRDELSHALEYVNLVGAKYEDGQIAFSEDTAHTLLVLKNSTNFSRLFLSDAEGNCISNTGVLYDMSERGFYRRAMFGESTIGLEKSSDGQEHILISAPVLCNGKVVGAVHGELDLYSLYKIMNANSFDGKGYATLVNTSGDYIISSDNEHALNTNHDNIFDWLKTATLADGMTSNKLKVQMENNKSGILLFSAGSESRVLCYLPTGVNDWYLMQQVSDEYVDTLVSGTNRNVFALVAEVCVWIMLCVCAVAFYVKKQRRAQEAAVKRFITLSNNIPGGVTEIEISDGYTIRYANDGFYALTGYSKEEFETATGNGRDILLLATRDEKSLLQRVQDQIQIGESVSVEYRILRKDGEIRWLNTVGTVIERSANSAVLQAIVTDITMQKEQNELVVDRAKHDKMTQLYDKISFAEIINQILRETGENTNVVIVLDIDNFKHINDTYGHQIGDTAIIAVAGKLKEHFRNTDIIGRVGGDEFAVCMCNVPDTEFVKGKLEYLLEKIRGIVIADTKGLISCSAGCVVIHPFVKTDYQYSFRTADNNLYEIKKNNKGSLKLTEMFLDAESAGSGEEAI